MDRDTPAIQRARYHDLLRGQAPHQRLRAAIALTTAVRELAVAGLRSRHPGSSDREIQVRLAVRLYGRSVGERLFGNVPDDAV